MSKHTPGPWRRAAFVVGSDTERIVAVCQPDDGIGGLKPTSEEECIANADLMAEAPAMLDALLRIQGIIDHRATLCDRMDLITHDERENFRAVIKRVQREA